MGYTHYWNFKKNPSKIENGNQKFITAVELIKEGVKQLTDIELAGGYGEGEPIFSENKICFNGKGEDAYETCGICFNEPNTAYFRNFCKTKRQPYDVVVCLTLLCLKETFGNDFSFSSDGNTKTEKNWVRARKIFKSIKDKRLD